MELIKAELYKVYIKRSFLLFVILLFLFQIGTTLWSLRTSLVLKGDELTAFKSYIAEYGGEITEETQEKIENLIKENEQIYEEIEKLNSEFSSDLISEEEYNKQIGRYNSRISEAEGFNAFVNVYRNALTNDRPIIDTTGWSCLFFDRKIDIAW